MKKDRDKDKIFPSHLEKERQDLVDLLLTLDNEITDITNSEAVKASKLRKSTAIAEIKEQNKKLPSKEKLKLRKTTYEQLTKETLENYTIEELYILPRFQHDVRTLVEVERPYISRKYFKGKPFKENHVQLYILTNTKSTMLNIYRIYTQEPEKMQLRVLRTMCRKYFTDYYERYIKENESVAEQVIISKKDADELLTATIKATYQETYTDVMYLLSRGGLIDATSYLTKAISKDKEIPKMIEEGQAKSTITTYISDNIVDAYVEKISVRKKDKSKNTVSLNMKRDLKIKQEYAPKSAGEKIIEKNIEQYYRIADSRVEYVKGTGIIEVTLADGSWMKSTILGYKDENGKVDLDLPYCEIYSTGILCIVDGYPRLFDMRTVTDANDFVNKKGYVEFATYFYTESFKRNQPKKALQEFDKMIQAMYNAKNTTVTKWLAI